jgi:hypothetical protein
VASQKRPSTRYRTQDPVSVPAAAAAGPPAVRQCRTGGVLAGRAEEVQCPSRPALGRMIP